MIRTFCDICDKELDMYNDIDTAAVVHITRVKLRGNQYSTNNKHNGQILDCVCDACSQKLLDHIKKLGEIKQLNLEEVDDID